MLIVIFNIVVVVACGDDVCFTVGGPACSMCICQTIHERDN